MSDPVRAGETTHIGAEVEGSGLRARRVHPRSRPLGRPGPSRRPGARARDVARHERGRRSLPPRIPDDRARRSPRSRARQRLVAEDPGRASGRGAASPWTSRPIGRRAPTLREAEAKYRLLVEQIPAVTYIDEVPEDDPTDLTPAYISPQLERCWVRAPRMARRPGPLEPGHASDDVDAAEAAARRSFEDGSPLSIGYRMVARDGRTVWVREEASLYRDENGAPKFWQGVYFDITDLKRAEELKNTFLQAVSHDLRRRSRAILGFALTLAQERLDLLRCRRARSWRTGSPRTRTSSTGSWPICSTWTGCRAASSSRS